MTPEIAILTFHLHFTSLVFKAICGIIVIDFINVIIVVPCSIVFLKHKLLVRGGSNKVKKYTI